MRHQWRVIKLLSIGCPQNPSLPYPKELPNDEQVELENIQNENIENFEPYEPLRIPFECESCSFFTTDSVLAAHHTDFHNELVYQAKHISRWEPSTASIRTSVIVANPRASVIVANPNCLVWYKIHISNLLIRKALFTRRQWEFIIFL